MSGWIEHEGVLGRFPKFSGLKVLQPLWIIYVQTPMSYDAHIPCGHDKDKAGTHHGHSKDTGFTHKNFSIGCNTT